MKGIKPKIAAWCYWVLGISPIDTVDENDESYERAIFRLLDNMKRTDEWLLKYEKTKDIKAHQQYLVAKAYEDWARKRLFEEHKRILA